MLRRLQLLNLVFIATLATGCDPQASPADQDDDGPADDAQLADVNLGAPDSAPDSDSMSPPDLSVPDGGALDQNVTDSATANDLGPARSIETCEAACARVSECERDEIFGGPDACLAACALSSRDVAPEGWFDCLEVETCNLLHLCRLPEPAPLTCEQLCQDISTCGASFDSPDCLNDCEARNGDGQLSICGELLFDGRCDLAEFNECLARNVFPECSDRCDTGLECNLVRQGECLPDCIRGLLSGDALTRHRSNQLNRCVALSRDCVAADRCFNPPENEPVAIDQASFCRLWDPCFGNMLACEEVWQLFGANDATVACAARILQQGCPQDPFFLFMQCVEGGGGNVDNGCGALCEAMDICEQLPEEQARAACLNECNAEVSSPDAPRAERQRRRVQCGTANSCGALEDCLTGTEPQRACPRHCEQLAACGQAAPECEERCTTGFLTARHTDWRDCVDESDGDCERVSACTPVAAVGCDLLCDRLATCGQEPEDCPAACDDTQYQDFDASVATLACVLSASSCEIGPHSVRACMDEAPRPDRQSPGDHCLAYCRTLHGCDPGGGSVIVNCIADCAEGLSGLDAHRFARGMACAADAIECDQNGPACFPEAAPPPCDDWCDQLAACDAEPSGCDENCDPLSQRRNQEQSACLNAAQDECAAVQACSDRAAPGLEEENLGQIDYACRQLCVTQAECGQLEGSIRECAGACLEEMTRGVAEARERQAGLLSCRAAQSCRELTSCFDTNSPLSACREHCERRATCGAVDDECEAECDTLFYRTRHQSFRQCVAMAAPYDAAPADWDCAGVMACDLSPTLDCEAQCARLAACGTPSPDCLNDCDDENFNSPALARQRFACVASAPNCQAGPDNTPDACMDNPATAGGDCLQACSTTAECNEHDSAELSQCLLACGLEQSDVLTETAEAIDVCLVGVDENAVCGHLESCSAPPLGVNCMEFCGALDECGNNPDDCLADCEAGGLAMLRGLRESDCIANANGDCDAISECSGVVEPLPEVNEAQVCQRIEACGALPIPCGVIFDMLQLDQAQLQCVWNELEVCPPGGDFQFLQRCLEGPGAPRRDISGECREYCAGHSLCGLSPLEARDCWGNCTLGLTRNPDHPFAERVTCRTARTCADLEACLTEEVANPCQMPCQAAVDCGAFQEQADCELACERTRLLPRTRAGFIADAAACIDGLDAQTCPEEGAACFSSPAPLGPQRDCDEACELLAQCGAQDPRMCVDGCNQAMRERPEENQRAIDCIINNLNPPACDMEAAEACMGERER